MVSIGRYFKKKLINFPTKIRIFIPILITIIISVSAITYYSIYISKKNLNDSIKKYLKIEVQSLVKMFEREYELKTENARKDLKVINELFYQKGFFISDEKIDFTIYNPESGINEISYLNKWFLKGKELHYNYDFVDMIRSTLGSKATVFQKTEKGFVRISTNVTDDEEKRAVGTLIKLDSPIAESINRGENYFGRSYVVNDWYITGYGPVRYKGETVGLLFVGSKEKDLPELEKKFNELDIGNTGFPFVFDNSGKMIIQREVSGLNWIDDELKKTIMQEGSGVKKIVSAADGRARIIAYDYFPEFEYYICAFVNEYDESGKLISHLIIASIAVSVVIMLIISLTVYFMTIEKLHSYLETLENKNQQISDMKEALKHSEKLATMGQLSAGIAHEVNNPLGVVTMYSHILMEECDKNSEIYQDLETIATQANRCKTILSGLLNFARKNEVNLTKTKVDKFFSSVKKSVILPKSVQLTVSHADPGLEVSIDESQMLQVYTNLINNSVDAVKSSGRIKISTYSDKQNVIFVLEDNGPGISEENQKRLFEPFFSTKQMGKGTGLGLAVVYGIIKMHRGKIMVESNADPAKGQTFARFIISLPKNTD
jgi:signal transduction histidine kinase